MDEDEFIVLLIAIVGGIVALHSLWRRVKNLGVMIGNSPKWVKSAGMNHEEYNSAMGGWTRRYAMSVSAILISLLMGLFGVLWFLYSDMNLIDEKPLELIAKLGWNARQIVGAICCGALLIIILADSTQGGD